MLRTDGRGRPRCQTKTDVSINQKQCTREAKFDLRGFPPWPTTCKMHELHRCVVCGFAFYGKVLTDELADPEAPLGVCIACKGDRLI